MIVNLSPQEIKEIVDILTMYNETTKAIWSQEQGNSFVEQMINTEAQQNLENIINKLSNRIKNHYDN